jgi:hypothetical protein
MWKRAFIRVTMLTLIIITGLLVFAASRAPRTAAVENTCPESLENCSNTNKAQGDFMIWESISRTLMSNVQY